MNKNFLFKFIMALGVLAAAVMWLLVALEVIPQFKWAWTVVIIAGSWGLAFLLKGFSRNNAAIKKMNVFVGVALLTLAVIALIIALAVINVTGQLVFAIAATALAFALVVGILVTGGKKWDSGDNQKVGYKNYHQRKAEEEKAKAKENSDEE